MYLAALEESISAILMAERSKKQVPMYFILADFLAEKPSKEGEGAKDKEAKRKEPGLEKAWKLFTDGASSSEVLEQV
ncbi:hypothetical protein Tco_0780753 [Tanacetum coccineum]